MMTRIDRYLVSNHLLGVVPVLFLLLGLFGFVGLAEELESVGEGHFEDADALRVALLMLPRIAIDLLPVAALIGGVMALGAMASSEEITAMRASGMSVYRLARPLAFAAFFLTALTLLGQQFAIPLLEQQASDLRSKQLKDTLYSSDSQDFWTRGENQFVRIGEMRLRSIPSDIEIYSISETGKVRLILRSEFADVLDANKWLLHNVKEFRVNGEQSSERTYLYHEWDSFLSQNQMDSLVAPVDALSLTELYDYVEYLELAGLRSQTYEFRLWQNLSRPLGLLAMCFLALPFVVGSVRTRAAGTRVLFGMIVGIGFYLTEQMSSQLTLLYELPTMLMALLPDCLLLLVSFLFLARAP